MNAGLKQTPFTDIHRGLGAKLVAFGGYEMPVQYSGIIEEHKAVRSGVGLFDVSHMGEFFVGGPDRLALVQRVTTNDASRLTPGKVQYSAMCTPSGGIVDDLLVYHMGDTYMLVVNASNIAKDLAWITSQRGTLNATVEDRSDETALLAVQGPRSLATLAKLTGDDLASMEYYTWRSAVVAGVPMTVSRTGYTGELGFELYFRASAATAKGVWDAIMTAGAPEGIRPAGLGARDTLRLEMGFCLYGNDIDETTNPLEAGLGWITKLAKGEFIGRAPILAVKERGPERKLVGFVMEDERAFPRHGYEIRTEGGRPGHVTSGTVSPMLEKGIGMGYVDARSACEGGKLTVVVRGREAAATVVPTPFIRK